MVIFESLLILVPDCKVVLAMGHEAFDYNTGVAFDLRHMATLIKFPAPTKKPARRQAFPQS